MSLITLDEARDALKIDASDTNVNVELQRYVDAITTVVANHVGEVIEPRTVTERLRLRNGKATFTLGSVPVTALTSLTGLDGIVWDVTGMDVDPNTGTVEVFRGPEPFGTVIAVYTAGYVTPPNNYKRGALVILEHVWETQRGLGDLLSGVVGAEERYTSSSFDIPRKALEWLGEPAPGVG